MASNLNTIVIVGGGITGLTTAYYLQQQLAEKHKNIKIILIEASHKLGGKIETEYIDSFLIEHGPDSLLVQESSAIELAEELKMTNQIVRNEVVNPYILLNNELYPIPNDTVMGIPTTFASILTTGLLSVQGKLRAGFDLLLPKTSQLTDQSVGKLIRSRLGDEVVEHLVEPVFSSLFAGDIDELSVQFTFPQLDRMKDGKRSLILNIKDADQTMNKEDADFITLAGGLQTFITEIENQLDDIDIMTGVRVLKVNKDSNVDRYTIELNNNETLYASNVVFTTSHHALESILPTKMIKKEAFPAIPATSVATVTMAFDTNEVDQLFSGTGFVAARNSHYTITGCTWTHRKWPHTTPRGKALLRCYIGRLGDETVIDLSDDEIEKIVLSDLKEIINLNQKPHFTVINRLHDARPHYEVGHSEKVDQLKMLLKKEMPNVHLAGLFYEGTNMSECIKQGKQIAQHIYDTL